MKKEITPDLARKNFNPARIKELIPKGNATGGGNNRQPGE
jgi:hypothetical protein